MTSVVELHAASLGRMVSVRRGQDVPDPFWLQARAHWGSAGLRPGEELEVSVERFLANLGWLAPACRARGVSLLWDDDTSRLVERHKAERRLLRATLNAPQPLAEPEARAALAGDGTRFQHQDRVRGFQWENLGKLLGLPHGANFSVPGAGKTAVTLALYEAERLRGRVQQMLVIAPLSAFEAWQTESAYWLDPAPVVHTFDGGQIPESAEILLVNYQRLLFSFEAVAAWATSQDTHICLDEAHRIKRGRAGEWGSAALDLGFLGKRRDVLTGTPAPQAARDLGVLLDFVWWGQGHEVMPAAAMVTNPPEDATRQVADAIRPLFVRTTKHDLELPTIELRTEPVALTGLHADIYAALRSQYAGRFAMGRREGARWSQMGQVVMYLLEAATNPGLLAAGSSQYDPIEFLHPPLEIPENSTLAELVSGYGAYETPQKFAVLGAMLKANRAQGRKTLVWTNFVRNLQILERMLAGLNPAIVHGGIPSVVTSPDAPRTREDELRRFREDPECWVLLANPAAMAEGVSLHTACHDAIYVERTFNAGQYLQSLDRIHRLGLTEETRVTFLVTRDTIDEVVRDRVRAKAEHMALLLDDPAMLTMALPDEDDVGEPLDPTDMADLAALFAHLRGDTADG